MTEPEDMELDDGEGAWGIAWRQFKKHRLAMIALVAVGLLFVVAVFAPFLANELPIYVRAALPARYENAFFAYDDTQRLLKEALTAPKRDDAKVEALALNMRGRLEDAAYLLADAQGKQIADASAAYDRAVDAARKGGALDAAAWDKLRLDLEPLSPDGDVKVVPRAFWPVFRSLEWREYLFLFIFGTLLLSPLFSRAIDAYGRARVIDPMNLTIAKTLLILLLPTVLTVVVPLLAPRKEDPDRKTYKKIAAAARAKGDRDTVVIFPPVPYGENENILEDQRVKPTWLLSEREKQERVIPDLMKAQDEARDRLAMERFPEEVKRRRKIIGDLDVHAREVMRDSIFSRAWQAITPPKEIADMHRDRAAIDAKLDDAIREQKTPVDEEIRKTYPDKLPNLNWHWLGTDTNGRDVLARMIYGARVSMSVGFVAEGIAVAIGIFLGALAGYFRGWVDIALSRIIEVVICFPTFFFILTILAMFDTQSIMNIMVVIGITGWPGVARLMRAEYLRLGGLDFVTAGKALGLSDARIIFRHILPNGLAPILVSTTFGIAGAILVESALSFLGFGVPQPTASWGDTLNNGSSDPQGTWWLTIFPGTALFLTVTAYNLVGDAIRDATDPRLRQ